jgi:hypothetical protein
MSGHGSDNAWRLNARYELDRFSANCEWLRTGDDFRGGWRDTELRRMNVSWSVLKELNIWANYNQTQLNLSGDPEEQARHNRNIAFGATWNAGDFGQLRVSHRIDRTWDIFQDEYDITRTTTEYSFSRNWGEFRVSASWQEKTDEDQVTDNNETDSSLQFDCAARLNSSISARLGYSTGRISGFGEETNRYSNISLGGDFTINRDLDMSVSVQRNTGGLQGTQTSINGSLNWETSGGSVLNLNVRSYNGEWGGDTELALGYTYPLSIPLTMFPRKGSMEGRVFLSNDPAHGIANARISVGQVEMVTDENGHFSFPSLDPGEHQLTLDTTSLGVGMTPEVELPLVFLVEAGSNIELEIPVMQSVAIGGQVFLETPGSHGEPASRQPISGMAIELQSQGVSSYRLTDSYGRFLFADLTPGSFVVILRSDWLPQWHQIVGQESYELTLAPGESRRDLVFTIAPSQRQIDITTEAPEG